MLLGTQAFALGGSVGKLLLKFAVFKIPITAMSVLSLWIIRREFAGMFWAAWANSLLTQATEFLVLRTWVFTNGASSKFVPRQFLLFWAWAVAVGLLEGLILENLEARGWPYLSVYVVGHIPTFFLRFIGDQLLVFRKRGASQPPGSH